MESNSRHLRLLTLGIDCVTQLRIIRGAMSPEGGGGRAHPALHTQGRAPGAGRAPGFTERPVPHVRGTPRASSAGPCLRCGATSRASPRAAAPRAPGRRGGGATPGFTWRATAPRGRSFFFSSRKQTQDLGRPRSLDCSRIRTPLRFRVGALPRRCLWEVVPPGRSAALVVVVIFFYEGLCVRARRAICADAAWRTRATRCGARGTRNKVTPGSSVRVAFGSSYRDESSGKFS